MVYMSYTSMKYLSEEKLEKFINEIINTVYMSYASPKHIIEYFKRIRSVNKVARIINRITNDDNNKKDMGVNITLFLYDSPFNDGEIQITANIFGFESILNELLSDPIFQMFWNDVKEKYGKDVDEKELYKILKTFIISVTFLGSLEDAKKAVAFNTLNSSWSYDIYNSKDLFDGKLDKATF